MIPTMSLLGIPFRKERTKLDSTRVSPLLSTSYLFSFRIHRYPTPSSSDTESKAITYPRLFFYFTSQSKPFPKDTISSPSNPLRSSTNPTTDRPPTKSVHIIEESGRRSSTAKCKYSIADLRRPRLYFCFSTTCSA